MRTRVGVNSLPMNPRPSPPPPLPPPSVAAGVRDDVIAFDESIKNLLSVVSEAHETGQAVKRLTSY